MSDTREAVLQEEIAVKKGIDATLAGLVGVVAVLIGIAALAVGIHQGTWLPCVVGGALIAFGAFLIWVVISLCLAMLRLFGGLVVGLQQAAVIINRCESQ